MQQQQLTHAQSQLPLGYGTSSMTWVYQILMAKFIDPNRAGNRLADAGQCGARSVPCDHFLKEGTPYRAGYFMDDVELLGILFPEVHRTVTNTMSLADHNQKPAAVSQLEQWRETTHNNYTQPIPSVTRDHGTAGTSERSWDMQQPRQQSPHCYQQWTRTSASSSPVSTLPPDVYKNSAINRTNPVTTAAQNVVTEGGSELDSFYNTWQSATHMTLDTISTAQPKSSSFISAHTRINSLQLPHTTSLPYTREVNPALGQTRPVRSTSSGCLPQSTCSLHTVGSPLEECSTQSIQSSINPHFIDDSYILGSLKELGDTSNRTTSSYNPGSSFTAQSYSQTGSTYRTSPPVITGTDMSTSLAGQQAEASLAVTNCTTPISPYPFHGVLEGLHFLFDISRADARLQSVTSKNGVVDDASDSVNTDETNQRVDPSTTTAVTEQGALPTGVCSFCSTYRATSGPSSPQQEVVADSTVHIDDSQEAQYEDGLCDSQEEGYEDGTCNSQEMEYEDGTCNSQESNIEGTGSWGCGKKECSPDYSLQEVDGIKTRKWIEAVVLDELKE